MFIHVFEKQLIEALVSRGYHNYGQSGGFGIFTINVLDQERSLLGLYSKTDFKVSDRLTI
jgi:hypothetical protein